MPYKDKAKQTSYQNEWMQNRRRQWLSANGPCQMCASWENLVVDHVDANMKASHKIWSWSAERRAKELAKCQALCRSCHAEKTTKCKEHPQGEDNGNAKLTWEAVTRIRAGESAQKIAEEFNIDVSNVYRAKRGDTWKGKDP